MAEEVTRAPNILCTDRNSYNGEQTAATTFEKRGGLLTVRGADPRFRAYGWC